MSKPKHIVIITGEPSGDMRGAGVVRALKKMDPTLLCSGIGGSHMKTAGVECFDNIDNLAVMGFTDVIKHYSRIRTVFNNAFSFIKQTRPDAVIFIDYPSFNLKLAQKVKKLGLKTLYYISPKVWAWKEHRVKTIQHCIDKMIVIFPFEKAYYEKKGVHVEFVGHPLVDEIEIKENRDTFLSRNNLDLDKKTIGLLPGSRINEIERHLPLLLQTAKNILAKNNQCQFILFRSREIKPEIYDMIINQHAVPVTSTYHYYEGLHATHACIVASGTATLEVGLLQKPMAVMYKVSPLSHFIIKRFIKIPYASLVNIILNRCAVNEFLQDDATAENLTNEMLSLLTNIGKSTKMEQDLLELKHLLGEGGASQRAGKIILETIFSN